MLHRKRQIFALALLALSQAAWTQTTDAQGKLGRIRHSVRESKSNDSGDGHSTEEPDDHDERRGDDHDRRRDRDDHHRNRHHRKRNSHGWNWIGPVCSSFSPAPTVVIYEPVAIGCGDVACESEIQSYIDPDSPVVPSPVYESVIGPVLSTQFIDWRIRVTGFGGSDFNDMTQGGLGVLLQSPGGLGLDTSVTMFRETGMSFRDHLWIGDVNLVKEVAVDRLRARMGLGLNWMGDSWGGDAGFNLTAGLDYRVSDRTRLAAEIDFGTLGDTDLFHTQITLARKINIFEWVVGYDHYDIGGTTLGGAIMGLRFRY